MAPPTILYLLDYTDLGGGETSLLALIEAWRHSDAPWQPEVIMAGHGPVQECLADLGIPVHVVAYPRRLRRGPVPWFSLTAAHRVDRLIAARRPVLLHANNFFGLLYAGPAARLRHLPLVWTCHGWFELDSLAKRAVARLFATHVTCVSEAVRTEAARMLGCPDRTSTDYLGIVPFHSPSNVIGVREEIKNPLPATRYPLPGSNEAGGENIRDSVRREFYLSPHTPLIAVVGRFQPIKGHSLLLDALAEIRRHLPDLKVWFIGEALFDSPEETDHKARIEQRVRKEGLDDCVRFLGFRADARRLLRALDVLIIPSSRESFSMVAVECLEAGVPVIGPDGWGPREIIEAPATGLLFQPDDSRDLALKAIQALTRSGPAQGFDPEAGPRRVARIFTAQAHLERTLTLYRSLLSAGPYEGTRSKS